MKNRKRFLAAVLAAITFVLVGVFAACDSGKGDPLSDCKQWIQSSEQKVQTVELTLTMKDSGVKVYEYEKLITFGSNNSATVKTVESKLNSSFVLEGEESTDIVENVKKADLLTISLERKNIDTYDYKDNRLSVLVDKDKVDDVFGWEMVEANNYVQIVFEFSNKRMTSAFCSFKTATGKDVVCNVAYTY